MKQTKAKPNLPRLRQRLNAHRITQVEIARAAGVKPPHVNNVLAGRHISGRVIEAALRLIKEAKTRQGQGFRNGHDVRSEASVVSG